PRVSSLVKKNNFLVQYRLKRKPLLSEKRMVPLPDALKSFPRIQFRLCRLQPLEAFASETDIAVEESSDADILQSSVSPEKKPGESSEKQTRAKQRSRKSEMPAVKNEELLPGSTFIGKVRSIQPFGAFVDFGAFTDGLVHVSQLSDSFVKDVASVVSVGQEVKVRLVEVNMETRRISLSMRENDDAGKKEQQQKEGSVNGDRSGPPRRRNAPRKDESKKTSKFLKGQDLVGTVKNLVRAGAFISLPDGEEGFLPTSEQPDEGFVSMMGGGSSSLEVDQEVNVRVLRISRGKVTLTMKKEEDGGELDSKLNQGVVHKATNPFVLAFRRSEEISSFLDGRRKDVEQQQQQADEYPELSGTIDSEISGESLMTDEPAEEAKEADDGSEISGIAIDGLDSTPDIVVQESSPVESASDAISIVEEQSKAAESDPPPSRPSLSAEVVVTATDFESIAESYGASRPQFSETPEEEAIDEEEAQDHQIRPAEEEESLNAVSAVAGISPALVKRLREETGAGMMDCKKALSETGGDVVEARELLRKKGLASADKRAGRATAEGQIGSYIHDSRIGVLVEVNCETDFVSRGEIFEELVEGVAMQVAACPQVEYISIEDVPVEVFDKEKEIEMQKDDLLSKPEAIRSKIVEGRVRKRLADMALLEQPFIKDDKTAVKDWVKRTISTVGENIKVKRFVRYNLGEGLEKKSHDFASEVAAAATAETSPKSSPATPQHNEEEADRKPPAVVISAALVKQLREETGAGMMDCKRALAETGGELDKAREYLRKKGLSSADKKSSRLAAEGRIGSYIHDSRIGVLIEVNCETDFVGRSEVFRGLVEDLAMQAVACPQVRYVSVEDVPESVAAREKQLEMQREDVRSKPENIRDKIVEGRLTKRLAELALLEQPFIRNDGILVKDLVKQTVAALGENIRVRRFSRFTLGE
ncbi:hypothetical protein M569_12515, partial [Genlisea aurea]